LAGAGPGLQNQLCGTLCRGWVRLPLASASKLSTINGLSAIYSVYTFVYTFRMALIIYRQFRLNDEIKQAGIRCGLLRLMMGKPLAWTRMVSGSQPISSGLAHRCRAGGAERSRLFADAAVPDQFIKLEFFRRHAINLFVPGFAAFAIQFPYFGVAAERLRIVLRVGDGHNEL
jgi:hypothetical protein